MSANKKLVDFLREVRKRGYSDKEIIKPLIKKGWQISEINSAFNQLNNENNSQKTKKEKKSGKEKIEVHLDKEIYEIIRKRAKKNLLSIPEQIEDIIRRSCISARLKKPQTEKLDDMLVGIFSRRRSGRKRK